MPPNNIPQIYVNSTGGLRYLSPIETGTVTIANINTPWMRTPPQAIPWTPPVTINIGVPVVEMPGCVKIHKENAKSHAVKIAKLKLARDLKKTLSACQKDLDATNGDEDVMDLISKVEAPILDATADIYQSSNKKTEIIGEDIDDYIEFLSENVSDNVGIPTGFPRYDAAIGGGLRRKCVDLIAARPKVGKSMFGDAVAMNVSNLGIPVLMLDTEMSKEDHLNRMLANVSGVDINKISTGKFTENPLEKEKVEKAAEKLKENLALQIQ